MPSYLRGRRKAWRCVRLLRYRPQERLAEHLSPLPTMHTSCLMHHAHARESREWGSSAACSSPRGPDTQCREIGTNRSPNWIFGHTSSIPATPRSAIRSVSTSLALYIILLVNTAICSACIICTCTRKVQTTDRGAAKNGTKKCGGIFAVGWIGDLARCRPNHLLHCLHGARARLDAIGHTPRTSISPTKWEGGYRVPPAHLVTPFDFVRYQQMH